MDNTRLSDLRKLDEVRKDYSKPMSVRFIADRSFKRIQQQMKDPKLNSLREQLAKASKAHDEHESWKIERQIKEHLKEEFTDWKPDA